MRACGLWLSAVQVLPVASSLMLLVSFVLRSVLLSLVWYLASNPGFVIKGIAPYPFPESAGPI